MLVDTTTVAANVDDGIPQFLTVGDRAVGEYHCSGCGYGIAVRRELPVCPMCSGDTWEEAAWSPFSRARQ